MLINISYSLLPPIKFLECSQERLHIIHFKKQLQAEDIDEILAEIDGSQIEGLSFFK